MSLMTISLSWCSSQEKEVDFTKSISWLDQMSGVEVKKEEPIEVIEEDIVEVDSSTSGNNIPTADAIDSLSSIKN